jgi:hypothetical protein
MTLLVTRHLREEVQNFARCHPVSFRRRHIPHRVDRHALFPPGGVDGLDDIEPGLRRTLALPNGLIVIWNTRLKCWRWTTRADNRRLIPSLFVWIKESHKQTRGFKAGWRQIALGMESESVPYVSPET